MTRGRWLLKWHHSINGFKYDIEDEIFKGFKFCKRVKKKDLNLIGKWDSFSLIIWKSVQWGRVVCELLSTQICGPRVIDMAAILPIIITCNQIRTLSFPLDHRTRPQAFALANICCKYKMALVIFGVVITDAIKIVYYGAI